MKKREKDIIHFILDRGVVSFEVLLKTFDISKRTLYYDIANINKVLGARGTIFKVNKKFRFVGDISRLESVLSDRENIDYEKFLDYDYRYDFILEKILGEDEISIENLCEEMLVSKSTVVHTISRIKENLAEDAITLYYDKEYHLVGDEIKIRELYLSIKISPDINSPISEAVYLFDSLFKLQLTDHSKNLLSGFISFLQNRINRGHSLEEYFLYSDARELDYFKEIDLLLDTEINEYEMSYIAAYVSSLSSLNSLVEGEKINLLVDNLIDQLEQKLLILIKNKIECKESIARHLYSSFNRIKYSFPVYNPLLDEIKMKYKSIFIITEMIFKQKPFFPETTDIRDEEIAFVVSYLGAYISKENMEEPKQFKAIIACPNGLTVSKTIEYQIQRYFPSLKIVASIPISEIDEYEDKMDFIISTIRLDGYENVIVVNPLLRKYDVAQIMKKISTQYLSIKQVDIEDILVTISKYAKIDDKVGLKKELYNALYEIDTYKGGYPMLKELLTINRIQILEKIDSWEQAIELAAQPLLQEDMIESRYINSMIEGVVQYGPYIVLTDKFALAHARPENGVKQLSMSLLKVNQPFDLLGKEVNLIVILAATDNKSHLEALASLSEMMMEKENIESIISFDSKDKILDLIKEYS